MNYLNKAINSYNIPNLLLFGKDISTIDIYLKDLLNSKFKIISNKDTTIKDINYKHNNVYYEFNMTNIYKNDNFIEVINDIIICKDYYSDLSYKIIILNQFNDIKVSLQNILRVTIEKFRITTVFIIITNNYSNIIEPLKSRCLNLRFPILTDEEKRKIIYKNMNLKDITLNVLDNVYNLNNEISIIKYLNLDKKINYNYPSDILVNELINTIRSGLYNKNIHKKIREIAYKIMKYNVDISRFYYYLCSKILKENLLDRDIIRIIKLLNNSYYDYMRSYRKILILECLFVNLSKFYNLKLMNIVNK
tara:strand:- start:796 stop:1713 length:918 start_codon:yes stop_codon:yes gene_type:complete